eukprot:CAMPEP_0116967514 /NCGR_PEP_ID=MMETSP0467-20121206/50603_1 /TAXON_ID=283647 /ORGANISM="Mesodinium pulex, Strain SPMC105" /LENGTH=123 /DNA_ID=CAMNT_0004657451 /DNA_START=633 /DNA_END=1001 /DNA_ORIENTATION=+
MSLFGQFDGSGDVDMNPEDDSSTRSMNDKSYRILQRVKSIQHSLHHTAKISDTPLKHTEIDAPHFYNDFLKWANSNEIEESKFVNKKTIFNIDRFNEFIARENLDLEDNGKNGAYAKHEADPW